jgi:4-carboxymuconolactone decarboxylase
MTESPRFDFEGSIVMASQNENLGGRLPLLGPKDLAPAQAKLYKVMENTLTAWANQSGFVVKTRDGRFIGPFNPSLYSPGITDGFSQFMDAEPKNTKLDKRTRQIVILTVGAVWNSPYEVYAHSAEARKVGLPEAAIQALASGESPEGLTLNELVAHRFARQLAAERRVDDDLYRKAKQAFGEEGLVDMIYLIGIYLVTCALLNGFEIPAPVSAASETGTQTSSSKQY